MSLLIAEELLLLLYRPRGTMPNRDRELQAALGGALLTQLELD